MVSHSGLPHSQTDGAVAYLQQQVAALGFVWSSAFAVFKQKEIQGIKVLERACVWWIIFKQNITVN